MRIKKLIMTFAGLMTVTMLVAQTSGNNSPYSRYGLGTLADESQSFNRSMGGLALGMRGGAMLNRQNPASYSAIDSLTFLFDVGASFSTARMSVGGRTVQPQNTTFDYAQAAFRLLPRLGFSIGMRPFTNVGYQFSSSQTLEDVDGYGRSTNTSTYSGEGGTHLVYGGLGWSPLKSFSIGANIGYLWGDYSHSSSLSFSESTVQQLKRYYYANVNTWLLDLGLQYNYQLNKKNNVTIGVTAGVGHKINERASFINQKVSSSTTIGGDTIHVGNAFEIPWSFGVGLAWTYDKRWTFGVDYTNQLWKNCHFPELETVKGVDNYKVGTSSLSNRQKIVLGGQYVPKPEGFRFKDHMAYRAGVSYATSYYKVLGQSGPKTYNVNLGVGLPIVDQYSNMSMLSIGLQYEHVAPRRGQIKEDYLRLCLGLNFKARWFSKFKFE